MKSSIITILLLVTASIEKYTFTNDSVMDIEAPTQLKSQVILFLKLPAPALMSPSTPQTSFSVKGCYSSTWNNISV